MTGAEIRVDEGDEFNWVELEEDGDDAGVPPTRAMPALRSAMPPLLRVMPALRAPPARPLFPKETRDALEDSAVMRRLPSFGDGDEGEDGTATMLVPALNIKPLEEEPEGILAALSTWPVVWIGVALGIVLAIVDGLLILDSFLR